MNTTHLVMFFFGGASAVAAQADAGPACITAAYFVAPSVSSAYFAAHSVSAINFDVPAVSDVHLEACE